MQIFCDRHHSALFSSLVILFEERLGHKLYFPLGMEWYERELWNIYPHLDTAKQYLSLDQLYRPKDGTSPLNQIIEEESGTYMVVDPQSNKKIHGMSLEKFLSTKIDIVIASIPQHVEIYKELARKKGAKFIYQIGNAWSIEADTASNVMASAKLDRHPPGVNMVEYHQEFSLDIFCPGLHWENKNISSFVNCFNTADIFKEDWQLFLETEKIMPGWTFKSFGGQCRDGFCAGDRQVADRMRSGRFIWHTKFGGDGYGYVLFSGMATGTPFIAKFDYYRGKMGDKLLKEGITAISIDGLSPEEIRNKIEYWSIPQNYQILCQGAINNFMTEVNFDKDAEKVKGFLDNLV